MNRLQFSDRNSPFLFGEFQLQSQDGVRIYDGDHKTEYSNGELILTSHRLIWSNPGLEKRNLCLPLQHVLLIEEESGSFVRSAKLTLHLSEPLPGSSSSEHPTYKSGKDYIKYSFKEGGEKTFSHKLHDVLKQRQWEIQAPISKAASAKFVPKKIRSGIGGIEKHLQQKTKLTDENISKAFQDLDKLMEMAKPMVSLAKSISGKIREKQGEVTDDETVQFKSYLLSMGISDPVTKDTHGTGQTYYRELSKEVFKVLENPIQESGGMMTLTDAFVRINRARGLELLSPDDLIAACKCLPKIPLPLQLFTFPGTGVVVLRDPSKAGVEAQRKKTIENLKECGSLTAEELSRYAGVSVILAKERLLDAENAGAACRDDSVEGLRFYPNKFMLAT